MQSAFVAIGLERDAFLYVSDFFDEEEEIERIVMEKSRKGSAEDAKREANEQIERARIEREKQMEAAQEIAEPLAAAGETATDAAEPAAEIAEPPRRGRGRGRREREPVPADEAAPPVPDPITLEFGRSDFERIIDDEETTGEMFKDAYMQEAIVDQVRAIEFEVEGAGMTEVGSLINSVAAEGFNFERIADEDDESADDSGNEAAPKRGTRTRRTAGTEAKSKGKARPKATTAKAKETQKPSTKGRRKTKVDEGEPVLEDAEASVSEPGDRAEMTVRRGGRGRRRGGRRNRHGSLEGGTEDADSSEGTEAVEVEAAEKETADEVVAAPDTNGDKPRGRERRDSRDRSRSKGDNGRRQDRGGRAPQPTISDLLREGQEILVQIAKEPIARKGARITSHIAMPGRFLVYMPTIEHLGVSRKIESASERGRLRTLIQRIRQEEDIPSGGFIVRTAGVGISEEDLRQDARYLVRTWQDVKKASEKAKSPALVHQDLDLVQRLLRDQLSDEFTAIRVDSEEEYLRTVEFINRIHPRMVKTVKFYTREQPILDAYGVQEEIDKALKPRVWLRSGGYLVINQTEALVAIDVNTGKFVGKGNARLEDTITKTNLEAVDEIARQIRLRDLGGIIVLDLIDMEDRRNRHRVSAALQEALSSDKSPTKVLSFNDFGLIIMTRKRVKQSLERTMCAPCDYCEGAGWVKSPTTICYEILAEARRLSKNVDDLRQTTLRIHPDVAKALRSSERSVLEEIEAYLGNVDLDADPAIHQAQFDFAFV